MITVLLSLKKRWLEPRPVPNPIVMMMNHGDSSTTDTLSYLYLKESVRIRSLPKSSQFPMVSAVMMFLMVLTTICRTTLQTASSREVAINHLSNNPSRLQPYPSPRVRKARATRLDKRQD
jgi:hypothetical protein